MLRIVPGQLLEKIERRSVGGDCGLNRLVMRLNGTSHFRIRTAERTERLVVSIEQGPKLPIDPRIHSVGASSFFSVA